MRLLCPLSPAAAAAKSLQSCPTLCNPIDGSPPGSPVPGILQARRLEWVAISFSNAWKWKVKVKSFSRVRLFATPWTAAYQAPPPMGFSRQEYWSGVPLPSPSLSPGVCSNSCPLSQWCHPTISSSVAPISSCPQSFSAYKSCNYINGIHSNWGVVWFVTDSSLCPTSFSNGVEMMPFPFFMWVSLQRKATEKLLLWSFGT